MEGVPPEQGARLERTRSHLSEERDELEAVLLQLQEEHQRTQEELADARGEVQRQSEELVAVQHELEQVSARNDELEYTCEKLLEQRNVLDQKLRDVTEDLEEPGQEDTVQPDSATTAETPSTELGDGVADVDELRERLVQLRSENSALKVEVDELTEKNRGEEEARRAAEQRAREKSALAAAAERRERQAQEEQAKLATEYEELPVRLQEMQRLYQQAELERARMLEDMRQAEAAEQSMMPVSPDDGPSLFDQLEEETPRQPDEGTLERLKSSVDKRQAAQMELEENRREIRELRAYMDELQHKWDTHLLQTQREEAHVEQARQQQQQEEMVRSRSTLTNPRRWLSLTLSSYTVACGAVGAGTCRAACKAATPGHYRI